MMNKSIIFGAVLVVSTALLTSGLTLYGSHLFLPKMNSESVNSNQSEANVTLAESEIHFVDIKNIVITLTDKGRNNHYLLLDLAVTTDTQDRADRVTSSIALIKSSTVNLLTNMDYETLSLMNVSELRQKLSDEYKKEYSALNLNIPFNDVMISKMVFQ
jgi:flagellar FliL protein